MSDEQLVAGRYRLGHALGEGGMGVVWRARDELLDREVALKELRHTTPFDPAAPDPAYQRMLREAMTAAQLRHPGIITVHDVVIDRDRPWIVMELVEGPSVAQLVAERGPLPQWQAAAIGRQVAVALAAAHARGIVHRDVKPANILLDGDRAVLTDFGIAAMSGATALTGTGQLIGSPQFMAPERINGQVAGPPSDLWSLGITLYFAVSGRSPFDGEDIQSAFAAVLTREPVPLPHVPALWPVIAALLRKNPADRPVGAQAIALLSAPPPAHPAETVAIPRAPRRAGRLALVLGVVVLLLVTGGLVIWWQQRGEQSQAQTPPASESAPVSSPPVSPAQVAEVDGSPTMDRIQARGTVLIGVKNDQPGLGLQSPVDGTYAGFDIEIARILASGLGLDESRISYQNITASVREQALNDGTVDLYVGTYAITDSRKQQVGFAGPYLTGGQSLLVRRGEAAITGKDTLRGKKVCSVTGSSPLRRVEELGLTEPENVVGVSSYAECVDRLTAGQVDAVTTDDAILKGFAAADPPALKVVGEPFDTVSYGVGLALADKPLRDKVNDLLQAALDDGRWQGAYDRTLGPSGSPATRPVLERY
ncbi:bifunctional serine/threonine-protein kinase/glutamate ABC transporter substrate-binding protein [Amycolatopsis magusensis]|uniref:bifunctional serine/threonine-protein kinase/glutamate ABC transporter substrate-binding protein n=1 Tax=Amycolatopsis magusensis TaxID=882444 RepID=UPI0024A92309|nr:bifunctional serine/threonine-protein kinase/glutamate ABC transporter substrate-binding protein [Amycolatopsis magusensis]MDI5980516.1 bifunctional serine/threonine-protein kinase/glutamate ABC transporter substrate-binding protein [Amycolatopsis magusensis]